MQLQKTGLALLLLTLCCGAPAEEPAAVQGTWTRLVENAAFSPRDTAEGVVFKGRYWLSNGYYHGNVLHRDMWSSADALDWTLENDATPYDGYSELVVYQDQMWAIKGSVWRSVDGKTWTEVLDKTPFGVRGYGEAVVFRDAIWQLGSGADIWRSTDGVKWERMVEAAPYGERAASAVVVYQDKLWLLGGKTPGANDPVEKGYGDTTTHNDVWCSEDGVTWKQLTEHALWSPRQWFSAEVFDNRMWVLGGYDNVNGTNLGDVWSSDDGVTWQRFDGAEGFAPRHEPTTYVRGNDFFVVAGNTWPVVNDVWRLELELETGSHSQPTGGTP